jgi:hypothetical protein
MHTLTRLSPFRDALLWMHPFRSDPSASLPRMHTLTLLSPSRDALLGMHSSSLVLSTQNRTAGIFQVCLR